MKEFNQSVLGGLTIGHFLGLLFWALIGAYILMQVNANKRDTISPRTPVHFDWSFWIRDNAKRILFNLVVIVAAIRFSQEITKHPINEFWALLIGLSSDGIAWLLTSMRIIKLSGTAKPVTSNTDIREICEQELNKKESKQ